METFCALLALCAGNSLVTGEFHSKRPVTRSFDFFYLCLDNDWVNSPEARDLRRHRAHYDVIAMKYRERTVVRYAHIFYMVKIIVS